MITKLPVDQKILIIKRVLSGEKVCRVCREYGISRAVFYFWLQEYKHNLTLAPDGKKRGRKPLSRKIRNKIVKTALKNPSFTPEQLATELTVSTGAVWGVLKSKNLSTRVDRQRYLNVHGMRLFKDVSAEDKITMIRRFEAGEQVAKICEDFGISRVSFYGWLKRYKTHEDISLAVKNNRPAGDQHWNFRHGAEEKILQIITQHPEYGARKIEEVLRQSEPAAMSASGIYFLLRRLNLTTYEERLEYAKAQPVAEDEFPEFAAEDLPASPRYSFFSFLSPPLLSELWEFKQILSVISIITFSVSFGLFSFLNAYFAALTIAQKYGLTLSALSLVFGLFFFLYSLKYYLSIAVVLSWSRQNAGEEKGPWWARVFGVEVEISQQGAGGGWQVDNEETTRYAPRATRHNGLVADLSDVHLERNPFVSVHVSTFNEKRVIDRLLTACTSFEYPDYEVIVADDSTDETVQHLEQWAKHPRVKISHRNTRDGFKGGALQQALQLTDQRAEFILVLDADFIPYPDTIVQFLKYFQAASGSLGHANPSLVIPSAVEAPPRSGKYSWSGSHTTQAAQGREISRLPLVARNDNKVAAVQGYQWPSSAPDGATAGQACLAQSNIAAVQGYQWHVLNKSENWITRGVRTEYSGSYVIERSGAEVYGGLKQISGSVYMIRKDVLQQLGWGTSITEDFELTLKLYEAGYKVVYTPYIQSPAEAAATIRRLIRQRMRWAEGHSFNVKRMFSRLLFGSWKAAVAPHQEVGFKNQDLRNEGNLQSHDQTWVASPLTLAEKLEFLYLVPYYLQAGFFLLGTLCWFLAEVVLQAQLPFWTEALGWSLVFTNLFALPLMNLVGMFMEESEERDYLGLFSFVILSYIVAPFQAYAAVKGFFEKEEGPWFRTPKTGRITDTFKKGRVYRIVSGIFGQPVVNMNSRNSDSSAIAMENPYLTLATANNIFNSSLDLPRRKGKSFVRRSLLAFCLIIIIATSNLFQLEAAGRSVSILNAFESSNSGALVSAKKVFAYDETPTFKFRPAATGKIFSAVKKAYADEDKVGMKVYYRDIETSIKPELKRDTDGSYEITLNRKEGILKPGKYTIEAEYDGEVFSQDFRWGVLAMNTKKAVYTPFEKISFGFGVIDDAGETICNAKLEVLISVPSEHKDYALSSENGTVRQSGECGRYSVTNKADYLAEFTAKGAVEDYTVHVTAYTYNGPRTFDGKVQIRKDIPFAIERSSYPTRVYPKAPYPVTIKVTPRNDFAGEITEQLPPAFQAVDISDQGQLDGQGFPTDFTIKRSITWNVDWIKGQTYTLKYTVLFPQISPEFYLVGPLQFRVPPKGTSQVPSGDLAVQSSQLKVFEEARPWQVASDALSFRRSNANTSAASTTVQVALQTNATDAIFLGIGLNSATATVSQVNDSAGNSWTKAIGPVNESGGKAATGYIYYALNVTTAASITINVTASGSTNLDVEAVEYANISTSNALDKTSSTNSNSGKGLWAAGSLTTTQASEAIFTTFVANSTVTYATTGAACRSGGPALNIRTTTGFTVTEDCSEGGGPFTYNTTVNQSTSNRVGVGLQAAFSETAVPESWEILLMGSPVLLFGLWQIRRRKISHFKPPGSNKKLLQ